MFWVTGHPSAWAITPTFTTLPEEERLREIEEIAERALVARLSLADEMEAA